MTGTRKLTRRRAVLSLDPGIGDLLAGIVLTENGRSAAVAAELGDVDDWTLGEYLEPITGDFGPVFIPEDVCDGNFFGDFMQQYKQAAWSGYFGQECVHTRNNFDLSTVESLARYREYLERATDICIELEMESPSDQQGLHISPYQTFLHTETEGISRPRASCAERDHGVSQLSAAT